MITKPIRKVVRIDEEKCDGCGMCVPACAEGALRVVDGKAKLVSESYCDGLGACLGECPRGAIIIEERAAEAFDEAAARQHAGQGAVKEEALPCGCASSTVTTLVPGTQPAAGHEPPPASYLGHWPVQLALVPATAPFLRGCDLLVCADCVPFACPSFHRDLLRGRAVVVACPKLDDFNSHLKKLGEVLRSAAPVSVTVARMEVPCCAGLTHMTRQAFAAGEARPKLTEVVVGIKGELRVG